MKPDDASLDPASQRQVRKYADLLLLKAGAYGRFPTPVNDLVTAAELEIARENVLDKVFLGGLYRSLPNAMKLAPDRLKQAAGKVLGLLDRRDRTIHLDKDLHPKRVKFISVHEVGHDFLPWQRKTYDLLEDSESELDAETRDKFEREANCFTSDVLFQLDTFTREAADHAFGIRTPLSLSSRYGASFYATARRYVATNERPCALVVFNRPETDEEAVTRLTFRRGVASPAFLERYGEIAVPEVCGAESFFTPIGRWRSSPHRRRACFWILTGLGLKRLPKRSIQPTRCFFSSILSRPGPLFARSAESQSDRGRLSGGPFHLVGRVIYKLGRRLMLNQLAFGPTKPD